MPSFVAIDLYATRLPEYRTCPAVDACMRTLTTSVGCPTDTASAPVVMPARIRVATPAAPPWARKKKFVYVK